MKKGFFAGFKDGMHVFGNLISAIINTVLLTFVYVVGVGLSALIGKLTGKKALSLKRKPHWDKLGLKKQPLDNYYRQF